MKLILNVIHFIHLKIMKGELRRVKKNSGIRRDSVIVKMKEIQIIPHSKVLGLLLHRSMFFRIGSYGQNWTRKRNQKKKWKKIFTKEKNCLRWRGHNSRNWVVSTIYWGPIMMNWVLSMKELAKKIMNYNPVARWRQKKMNYYFIKLNSTKII